VAVVGWEEAAAAGAGFEAPAVVGLAVVVEFAEGVLVDEVGLAGVGPGFAVVDLDADRGVAVTISMRVMSARRWSPDHECTTTSTEQRHGRTIR
jgi:hypothetical protein